MEATVTTTCETCGILLRGRDSAGWHVSRCDVCGHFKYETCCACDAVRRFHNDVDTYRWMLQESLKDFEKR